MALITEQDDRSLVERFRAGDTGAFDAIVERHYPRLLANAVRRTGDQAQAEDCVQEALIRAYTRLHRFGDDGQYHLDAWLHTIVTNCCRDLGRRSGRDERLVSKMGPQTEFASPSADELVADSDPAVARALAALPSNYRDAVVKRFVQELDYDELAADEGISEQNARARVSRGRSMMRRLLDGAAGIIWLIPGLRRSDVSGQAEAANQAQTAAVAGPAATQAAPAVANAAPVLGHVAPTASQAAPVVSQAVQTSTVGLANAGAGLANVVPNLAASAAQVAPAVASAAPAVQSSAPAIGKAVVAVGLAATVAVPASGVVDVGRSEPEPETAAVVVEEVPALEPVDAPVTVIPQAETAAEPFVLEEVVVTGDSTRTAEPPGTGAAEAEAPAATPTTVAPTTTVAPAESEVAGHTTERPAPTAAPAVLAGDRLALDWAGPRAVLDGAIRFTDDTGRDLTGDLSARIRLGDEEDGPISVEGEATVVLADGSQLDVRLRGTATTDADRTEFVLDVAARIGGGAGIGLADTGTVTGLLTVAGDIANLRLDLPRTSDDGADAEAADDAGAADPGASDESADASGSSTPTDGSASNAQAADPADASDTETENAESGGAASDATPTDADPADS